MKRTGGIALFLLALVALFFYFGKSDKVSAQAKRAGKTSTASGSDRASDLVLADKIGRLTDRSDQIVTETKSSEGGTTLDLGGGYQNVMLARLDDNEPVSACVTSLGEANAFFGRDLQTGAAVPQTEFHRDPIVAIAARHGMSKEEFEFYTNLIAQAAKNRLLSPNAATITISNGDGAGEGFNDATAKTPEGGNNGTTIGQQRLNLFNFAAGIWGAYLDTKVPIIVNSQFNTLSPCTTSGGVLGSAGASNLHANFANAPIANTWYQTALASKLSGTDLNGATAEINAIFNTDVDTACLGPGTRFYYGLDNATPSGTINLLAVLLHELGHGLGFSSTANGTTGQFPASGGSGTRFPDVFSSLIYDRTTGKYWSQMTDAERLTSSTNSGNVFFDGANVKLASSYLTAGREASTGRVQLYAPSPYESGSSISHWDTAATPNLLMEPFITAGLPLTLDLTRQQMRDIGWYRDTTADQVPDTITNVQVSSSALTVGSPATVTWTNTGGFNRNVIIELSTNGGSTFPTVIASDVANTGSYNFTVPNNVGSTTQIRVREFNYVAPSGSSANFTINAVAAQPVMITGRVFYKSGRAVSGKIILALQRTGFETQYTVVNQFGYFRFDRVPAGVTYTISILGRNYVFAPQTVTTNSGNISGLVFTAQ